MPSSTCRLRSNSGGCQVQAAEALDVSGCRIEALLAIALIFGIFVTVAGAIAAFHLAVAAVAVYRLTGKYLWNIGGYEFCLFWAICCWIVAMHSFYAGGLWH